MQSACLNLDVINVFQMLVLLQRAYHLNKQRTNYVCIYVEENLKPQVMIASSTSSVVLNQI
jgi:hypothetical protein